ncbi:hypothetical protein JCM8547_005792 [Rhodosporidiobolus lusitaniae]
MATRTRMPRKATQTWGTNKTNKGKKALKRRKVEVEESEEDEEESEVEEEDSDDDEKDPDWGKPARKTKKRKTDGKGKVNGKKDKTPKVDYLETLPFDMLCEIFSYLHPGELLALARIAKPYGHLLMSKQSKFIWRKSGLFFEMPDLASSDFSEPAYVALFLDKAREVCDKKKAGAPNVYLRNRLRKDCRKDHLVKLHKLAKKHPEYHPLVSKVVVSTPVSPARQGYRRRNRYALDSDLAYYSRILSELAEDDEADKELAAAASSEKQHNSSSSPVSFAQVASANRKELEDLEKDSESLSMLYRTVMKAIVDEERRSSSVRWANYQGSREAEKSDQQRDKEQQARNDREANWAREDALMDKIAALPGLSRWPSLYGEVWDKSALVVTPRVLDDEESEEIKDDVLLLVKKWNNAILEREKANRKRYNRLRKYETDDFARAAYPLFVDFLRLESVKVLLLPEEMPSSFEAEQENERAELSDDDWEEQEELVKEELEQHRLDLVLLAIKLILRATTEDELPSDQEIVANLDEYDNGFFKQATSFLSCGIERCHVRGGYSWDYATSRYKRCSSRDLFVGDLQSLLEHQHKEHGDFDYIWRSPLKHAVPFHLALPVEVASAMSALLELGGFDDSTATEAELDDLEKKTSSFDWLNGHGQRKHFQGWRPLLDTVYRESLRFAKMKPRRAMDPPCIACKIRRKKRKTPYPKVLFSRYRYRYGYGR